MIPTLAEFREACCRWHGEHQAIAYELSWHGLSKYNEQGTWCYYLLLTQEQFYPDDWAKLRLTKKDSQLGGTSWHRTWSYDDFPDLDAHGGWTFGEMTIYLGKDGNEYEHIKVGCDYAHLWDRENGYWQGRADIERDAKRSIDLLCKMFPRCRERCSYSGKWDDAEQFYTARNGARVHVSREHEFNADHWPLWMRSEKVAEIAS